MSNFRREGILEANGTAIIMAVFCFKTLELRSDHLYQLNPRKGINLVLYRWIKELVVSRNEWIARSRLGNTKFVLQIISWVSDSNWNGTVVRATNFVLWTTVHFEGRVVTRTRDVVTWCGARTRPQRWRCRGDRARETPDDDGCTSLFCCVGDRPFRVRLISPQTSVHHSPPNPIPHLIDNPTFFTSHH